MKLLTCTNVTLNVCERAMAAPTATAFGILQDLVNNALQTWSEVFVIEEPLTGFDGSPCEPATNGTT